MKIKWNLFLAALLVAVGAIGTGCGGLSASHGVSPATFLIPGLGQNLPKEQGPAEMEVSSTTVAALDPVSSH